MLKILTKILAPKQKDSLKKASKSKPQRTHYYHVFKNKKAVRPTCSFSSKQKAYSFAQSLARQSNCTPVVLKSDDYTYKTKSEKEIESLDDWCQRQG